MHRKEHIIGVSNISISDLECFSLIWSHKKIVGNIKVEIFPNPTAAVFMAARVVTPEQPGPELDVTSASGALPALTPKEAPSVTGAVPGVPEWRICGEKQREQ